MYKYFCKILLLYYHANPLCGSDLLQEWYWAGVILSFPHSSQIRIICSSYNQDILEEINKHSPCTMLNWHHLWPIPEDIRIFMRSAYIYIKLLSMDAEFFVKWQSFPFVKYWWYLSWTTGNFWFESIKKIKPVTIFPICSVYLHVL